MCIRDSTELSESFLESALQTGFEERKKTMINLEDDEGDFIANEGDGPWFVYKRRKKLVPKQRSQLPELKVPQTKITPPNRSPKPRIKKQSSLFTPQGLKLFELELDNTPVYISRDVSASPLRQIQRKPSKFYLPETREDEPQRPASKFFQRKFSDQSVSYNQVSSLGNSLLMKDNAKKRQSKIKLLEEKNIKNSNAEINMIIWQERQIPYLSRVNRGAQPQELRQSTKAYRPEGNMRRILLPLYQM
eukprot:TRINITY_DN10958_c0_g1_i1.p1 TRINITY_DN10958_c0_g1~~TRINITY_DN10958_c0_g1_i1.p1  ORF type:complete len:247 (+),score=36.25 TRINITY_DN10958_c0_g1_i1:65-805(+)